MPLASDGMLVLLGQHRLIHRRWSLRGDTSNSPLPTVSWALLDTARLAFCREKRQLPGKLNLRTKAPLAPGWRALCCYICGMMLRFDSTWKP